MEVWKAEGAEIIDIVLPSLFEYQAPSFVIITSEAFALHEPWMRAQFNDNGELLRDRMLLGAFMTSIDYVQVLRRRRELCAITAEASKGVDVIVTAGAPAEAPRIDAIPKWGNLETLGFTNPFNITGWPAISVCSGYGVGGLPVAIQIAAKPFQEALLLQIAHAFEQAAEF